MFHIHVLAGYILSSHELPEWGAILRLSLKHSLRFHEGQTRWTYGTAHVRV